MVYLNILNYLWDYHQPLAPFRGVLNFRGLQWKGLLIYLDNLIIFSSDIPTHLQKLGEMLKLLKGAGLKLKPSKCHLLKTEVLFLGHIVS